MVDALQTGVVGAGRRLLGSRSQETQARGAVLQSVRAEVVAMIGTGDLAIRAVDESEDDARRWAATMTDADWLAEGKCPECRGQGFIGRHDCQPCGGTGEVVFCAVCGLVIEHGLIIRKGADKLHPACVGAAVEDGASS